MRVGRLADGLLFIGSRFLSCSKAGAWGVCVPTPL
jgi:hypothetical protein